MKIQIIGQLGANTGKTIGDVRMGRLKALILTQGFKFTKAQLADSDAIFAALSAAMLNPRSSVNKVYILTGFREVDDNTGDPNVGTLADGYEEVLNEALAKYVLRHTAGAAQSQSYEEFNGWNDGLYGIDDKNILFGVVDDNGGGRAFSCGYFYASYPRFGSSGAINTGQVRITFGSTEEFKKGSVFARKLSFSLSQLPNIVDIELTEVAAAAGYVFKFGATTKYAGTNIYQSYKALLAQTGAWKFTRQDTGATVPVDSVVADDTLNGNEGGWVVTLDDTSAIATGTKIKAELVDPTALKALATPVTGIESIAKIVTKAA